jgi:anthranilate synthase component I
VRYVETKKLPFSKAPHDDRNLPDIHLGLYSDVIVFVKAKMHATSSRASEWGMSWMF